MIKGSQTSTILPRNTAPHTNLESGDSKDKVSSSSLEIFGGNVNPSQQGTSSSSALFSASSSSSQDYSAQQNPGPVNTQSATHPMSTDSTDSSHKRSPESSDDLQKGRKKRARQEAQATASSGNSAVFRSQPGGAPLTSHLASPAAVDRVQKKTKG